MRTREDASASPRRVFGAMLRHYRTQAGLSREQLGARVYLSADMIGKVEQGERTPSEQLVGACEAVPQLGANGALRELRDQLKEHFRKRPYPGWFDRWPEAEANAQILRTFEPLVVPGLLQTEEYARAVLRTRVGDTDEEIEEMVAARLARQVILDRDQPPTLWVIIDEGVLRRPVGGAPVMAGQLRRLAELARRPDIVLQVIALSTGAHQGLNGGAFVVADFAASASVAYQDTALSGQIVDAADDIEALMLAWDTLRSEALPRTASLERIEEVLKTWT
jgi:transcriptional regulator with XRE-family HTH domain